MHILLYSRAISRCHVMPATQTFWRQLICAVQGVPRANGLCVLGHTQRSLQISLMCRGWLNWSWLNWSKLSLPTEAPLRLRKDMCSFRVLCNHLQVLLHVHVQMVVFYYSNSWQLKPRSHWKGCTADSVFACVHTRVCVCVCVRVFEFAAALQSALTRGVVGLKEITQEMSVFPSIPLLSIALLPPSLFLPSSYPPYHFKVRSLIHLQPLSTPTGCHPTLRVSLAPSTRGISADKNGIALSIILWVFFPCVGPS